MILSNKEIYKYSLQNPDPLLKPKYFKQVNILDKNNMDFFYDFKNLVITFSNIQSISEKSKILNKIKIDYINNNKFSNLDFSSFIFTKNLSKETIKKITDEELSDLIILFYNERIKYYQYNLIESNPSIMQVLEDEHSSRKHGKDGQNSLKKIFEDYNFLEKTNNSNFLENNEFIVKDSLLKFYIDENELTDFFKKSGIFKIPDFIFKYGEFIYFGEHKIINEKGGAQDKQLKELISFIEKDHKNKKIIYISLLEGSFIDVIPKTKIPNIQNNIELTSNYFLNSKGFEKLLESINN